MILQIVKGFLLISGLSIIDAVFFIGVCLPFTRIIRKNKKAVLLPSFITGLFTLNLFTLLMSKLNLPYSWFGYLMGIFILLLNLNDLKRIKRASADSKILEKFTLIGYNIGFLFFILQLIFIGSLF
ncbi:MAG: hypothetical protein ABIH87_03730 [bacterium]